MIMNRISGGSWDMLSHVAEAMPSELPFPTNVVSASQTPKVFEGSLEAFLLGRKMIVTSHGGLNWFVSSLPDDPGCDAALGRIVSAFDRHCDNQSLFPREAGAGSDLLLHDFQLVAPFDIIDDSSILTGELGW